MVGFIIWYVIGLISNTYVFYTLQDDGICVKHIFDILLLALLGIIPLLFLLLFAFIKWVKDSGIWDKKLF